MALHEDKRAASRSGRVDAPDQIYSLRFAAGEERSEAPPPDIEFHASNAYQALVIAHRQGGGRSVELWRDGKRLCTISELAGSFWEIRPCDDPGAGIRPQRGSGALWRLRADQFDEPFD